MSQPSVQPTSITYLNGQAIESISVQDRALHYGDGFFTTILVADRFILNWSAHCRRLKQSAVRLQFPVLDESQLLQQIEQALTQFKSQTKREQHATDTATYVVKVLVSRGVSGRGYAISEPFHPITLVQVSLAPLTVGVSTECVAPSEPQTLKLNFPPPMALQIECCQTQASIQTQLAGVKHLNRLDNVLARTEVAEKQHQEGLMLNALGDVISGTQSNLFLLKDRTLITPVLDLSGVEGTTRYQLHQLAQALGFDWQERRVTLNDLHQVDELFLSNAVRGIMPIKQFEQTPYAITKTLKIHQAWCQRHAQLAHALFDPKAIQL